LNQNASEEGTARAFPPPRGEHGEEETARTKSAVALASARSELAGLLHEQGKLLEAEELYRCVCCVRARRVFFFSSIFFLGPATVL